MATTSGPATGTASLFLGNPPTAGIEVQVPAGLPSLPPSSAPYNDPQQAGTSVTGQPIVPINTSIATGNGTSIRFANPA